VSKAIKRVLLKPKTKSMRSAPARVQQLALFGPPLLLEGEDEAAYDELLGRICAAVKPVNVIEEMFVADVVFLVWEILRLRRLKLSLLRTSGHGALEHFLQRTFDEDYSLYAGVFEENLAEILQHNLPENLAEDEAQELARRCARSEPDADKKVYALLDAGRLHMRNILEQAKRDRAKELVRAYARREPNAIKQVDELLAASGLSLQDMTAKGLTANIEEIERIDRLITIAERRRNDSLREIDRRRAALGEAVRRNVQEVEDAEFEVIETTRREGKSAA
jgi:hypothetical protein